MKEQLQLPTHIAIPDTQVKPGVPTVHLGWIGQYIVDEFATKPFVRVVHLGDHADMPSLSSWDYGKREYEGRRYWKDIEAANEGFDALNRPINEYNRKRATLHKTRWRPDLHILYGNHENRIMSATSSDPKLDGTIGLHDLNYEASGWQTHEFLKPIDIDGVVYSHYFYNPMSGTPYGGTSIDTRLKSVGHSFTMGHQQTLMYGLRFVNGKSQHGLVAGACYLHDEDYKGPQGNAHWRGIIVKHEVHEGSYDPMFVSLDYLCRRYEGMTLARFTTKKFGFVTSGSGRI